MADASRRRLHFLLISEIQPAPLQISIHSLQRLQLQHILPAIAAAIVCAPACLLVRPVPVHTAQTGAAPLESSKPLYCPRTKACSIAFMRLASISVLHCALCATVTARLLRQKFWKTYVSSSPQQNKSHSLSGAKMHARDQWHQRHLIIRPSPGVFTEAAILLLLLALREAWLLAKLSFSSGTVLPEHYQSPAKMLVKLPVQADSKYLRQVAPRTCNPVRRHIRLVSDLLHTAWLQHKPSVGPGREVVRLQCGSIVTSLRRVDRKASRKEPLPPSRHQIGSTCFDPRDFAHCSFADLCPPGIRQGRRDSSGCSSPAPSQDRLLRFRTCDNVLRLRSGHYTWPSAQLKHTCAF